ncbi:MAG: ribosome maturation factor RimM [Ornithinimicrobium sp.]
MAGQDRDALLVARIGRPHGLRGEVSVQVHTDTPDQRFVVGADFVVEPAERGPLTIRSVRVHQGRYLLGFEGVNDRDHAEGLRDTRLFLTLDAPGPPSSDSSSVDVEEPDGDAQGYYEDELVGMTVRLVSGEIVGEVSALHTRAVQDLLEISLSGSGSVLVPFVEQLVPTVDTGRREIVIDPPAGLLDVDG